MSKGNGRVRYVEVGEGVGVGVVVWGNTGRGRSRSRSQGRDGVGVWIGIVIRVGLGVVVWVEVGVRVGVVPQDSFGQANFIFHDVKNGDSKIKNFNFSPQKFLKFGKIQISKIPKYFQAPEHCDGEVKTIEGADPPHICTASLKIDMNDTDDKDIPDGTAEYDEPKDDTVEVHK